MFLGTHLHGQLASGDGAYVISPFLAPPPTTPLLFPPSLHLALASSQFASITSSQLRLSTTTSAYTPSPLAILNNYRIVAAIAR